MTFGLSIFLFALGAVLAFAVHASNSVVNVNTVGWILMGVGFVGFLLSAFILSSWSRSLPWRRRTVIEEDDDISVHPYGGDEMRSVYKGFSDGP
jgi:hypothetical protein